MSADLVLILGLVLLCLIMCPAVQGEGGEGERTMGLSDLTEQIDIIMIARACLLSKNNGGSETG